MPLSGGDIRPFEKISVQIFIFFEVWFFVFSGQFFVARPHSQKKRGFERYPRRFGEI
jgi:hypothetical protein